MPIITDSVILLTPLESHHVLLQTIGAIGSMIYVGSYLLVQCGHICGNSALDTTCKLLAAICVMISLSTAFNLATFLIQISFIAISIFGLWYRLSGRLAARRMRRAHIETMRRESLAGGDAWIPGETPRSSPLASGCLPGRRGHRDHSRWPRHEGEV